MDKMFTIGDSRIRISNIKNYGISDEVFYWAHVYRFQTEERKHLSLFKKKETTIKGLNDVLITDSNDICYRKMISKDFYNDVITGKYKEGKFFAFSKDEFSSFKKEVDRFDNIYYTHSFEVIGEDLFRSNSFSLAHPFCRFNNPYNIGSFVIIRETKIEFSDDTTSSIYYPMSSSDVFFTHERYLYITTYQGDNFKYYEMDGIDIDDCVKSLDSIYA